MAFWNVGHRRWRLEAVPSEGVSSILIIVVARGCELSIQVAPDFAHRHIIVEFYSFWLSVVSGVSLSDLAKSVLPLLVDENTLELQLST